MIQQIANLVVIANQMKEAFDMFDDIDVRADSFAVEVHYQNNILCKVLPEGEITIDNGGSDSENTLYIINTCLVILNKLTIYEENDEWFFEDHQPFHRHFKLTTY